MILQENKYINEELATYLKGLLETKDYVDVSEETGYSTRTLRSLLSMDLRLKRDNMRAVYKMVEIAAGKAIKASVAFKDVLNNVQ